MKRSLVVGISVLALSAGLAACERRGAEGEGRDVPGIGREETRPSERELPGVRREEARERGPAEPAEPERGLKLPGQEREEPKGEPKGEPPKGEPGAAPGAEKLVAIPQALSQIAEARCQREQRCKTIGEGKDFPSMDACVTKVQSDYRDDLNARNCPGGASGSELSECLKEIRESDCGSKLDELSRMAACRTSELCKAIP